MGFLTYDDGTLRFIDKTPAELRQEEEQPSLIAYHFYNLYSCNIENGVPGVSIKVVVKGMTSQIMLTDITSVELANETVRIATVDDMGYYLVFVNAPEAQQAFENIENAINGGPMFCSSTPIETPYDISTITSTMLSFPALIFVDDAEPFEASSKMDLVNQLNALYVGYATVSSDMISDRVVFSHLEYKKPYLPLNITALPQKMRLKVRGTQLKLKADFFSAKYYLFYNKTKITPNSDFVYIFEDETEKVINFYYSGLPCNYLEVGLAKTIGFTTLTTMPIITEFHSEHTSMTGLSSLFSNSTSLSTVTIVQNVGTLPNLSALPIERLIIKHCSSTTFQPPTTLKSLYVNDLSISSFSASLPNLKTLVIEECGKLTSVNLSSLTLDTLQLVNNPIATATFNNSWTKLKELKIQKSQLTAMSLTTLNSIMSCDISNNPLLSLEVIEDFLQTLSTVNSVRSGSLNVQNEVIPTNEDAVFDDLIDTMLIRNWVVVK